MNKELVSVIVPVYNVENELRACLDSIVDQTYQDLEIILINDGSKDNSGKICDEYARKDNRIRVIHKDNGGLSDSRNVGISISIGRYLAFVDSDDVIHHSYIDVLLKNIEEADLVICKHKHFSDDAELELDDLDTGNVEEISTQYLLRNLNSYKHPIGVVAWNKLYKRELWDGIRFPYGKIHEDEFVSHQIIRRCQKILIVDSNLYFYRKRENSIMSTIDNSNQSALDKMEAFYLRRKFYQQNNMDEQVYEMNGQILYRCLLRGVDNDNEIWRCMRFEDIFNSSLKPKAKMLLMLKKVSYPFYLFILNITR